MRSMVPRMRTSCADADKAVPIKTKLAAASANTVVLRMLILLKLAKSDKRKVRATFQDACRRSRRFPQRPPWLRVTYRHDNIARATGPRTPATWLRCRPGEACDAPARCC